LETPGTETFFKQKQIEKAMQQNVYRIKIKISLKLRTLNQTLEAWPETFKK